ncbi:hypothetical protein, partial [uncultured Selenomonas sp.]|uniref:hypothetical protein n=1 Tax=uncultured Selenomonas sp. TaxID=159275 RepID=UPI0028EB816A
ESQSSHVLAYIFDVRSLSFLYKTEFSGEENYVFCRIRTNNAKQCLYIHEAMKASEFVQQKSDTLLTQPANQGYLQLRGIALFKSRITDFLKGVNGSFYPEKKDVSCKIKVHCKMKTDTKKVEHTESIW